MKFSILDSPSPDGASWLVRIAIVFLLTICYALISHSMSSSVKSFEAESMLFETDDNESAEKRKTVQSTSALGFVTLGAVGMTSCFIRSQATRPFRGYLIFLIAIYLGWILLTGTWSEDVHMTQRKTAIILLVALNLLGISRHVSFQDIIFIILCVTAIFIISGFCVEIGLKTFRPLHKLYRFSGTVHPNEQSMYAAFFILCAWCSRPKLRWQQWGRYGLIAAGVVAMYLTKSRTTLGALAIAITFSEILRSKASHRVNYAVFGMAAISVLGFLLSTFGGWGGVGKAAVMGRTENVTSLTGRIPLWTELWRYADKKPMAGYGYGAFWNSTMVQKMSDTFFWEIMNSHSIYIDVILAVGFIGLGLYLAILLYGLIFAGYRSVKTHDPIYQFAFAIMIFALIHGLAESKFYEEGFGTYCLMLVLYRLARKMDWNQQSTRRKLHLRWEKNPPKRLSSTRSDLERDSLLLPLRRQSLTES